MTAQYKPGKQHQTGNTVRNTTDPASRKEIPPTADRNINSHKDNVTQPRARKVFQVKQTCSEDNWWQPPSWFRHEDKPVPKLKIWSYRTHQTWSNNEENSDLRRKQIPRTWRKGCDCSKLWCNNIEKVNNSFFFFFFLSGSTTLL